MKYILTEKQIEILLEKLKQMLLDEEKDKTDFILKNEKNGIK
jgi:hypothetical protein